LALLAQCLGACLYALTCTVFIVRDGDPMDYFGAAFFGFYAVVPAIKLLRPAEVVLRMHRYYFRFLAESDAETRAEMSGSYTRLKPAGLMLESSSSGVWDRELDGNP
jgi:hypothetical protein